MASLEAADGDARIGRAPGNVEFVSDLLRMIELWRDHPELPGPSEIGQVRVRVVLPSPQLHAIAADLELDVVRIPAGCKQVNEQADWHLFGTWVSLHALRHDDEAPEIGHRLMPDAKLSEADGNVAQDDLDTERSEIQSHHRRNR